MGRIASLSLLLAYLAFAGRHGAPFGGQVAESVGEFVEFFIVMLVA